MTRKSIKEDPFFRRPRTYTDINDANIKMAVKRALDTGNLKQVKFNYYFVEGWWNRLPANKWTVQDALLYLTLGLGKRFNEGKDSIPKNVDNDFDLLTREIKFFRLIGNVANGIAEELTHRAEILATIEQDSETEAAD